MSEILCSTGALLPYGGDYKLLEELSGKLQCDGFEFMMDEPYYDNIDALTEYLKKLNLYIPVVHCEKSIGESISKGGISELADAFYKFEINCELAKNIGARKMVFHLWDGRTSDSNFQNNLKYYSKLDQISRQFGIDLLVENVVCNVEDPLKHFCELREHYPDIHFIFDTKMAAFHKQLELLYATEYSWLWKEEHVHHYHVNDYGGGYLDWDHLRSLPIGKGKIDFNRFFEFIRKIGYDDTFTVESTAVNDKGEVDVAMLNQQFNFIRTNIKSKCIS